MTITVHHLEHSRSERIVWLLEELGVPYALVRHARDPKTMLAPPELFAIHPLGKAPVVVDDGVVLFESGAIIEQLIDRHGAGSGLRPAAGTPEHGAYTTWMHFAEGSAMNLLVLRLMLSAMRDKSPALARPLVRAITHFPERIYVTPNIARLLAFLDGELAGRPYFAGSAFTAADIQMSFALETARTLAAEAFASTRLSDYLSRMAGRPAYRCAKQKIGE